jgi:plastocyanin
MEKYYSPYCLSCIMNRISTTVLVAALTLGVFFLSMDTIQVFAQTTTTISMVPGSSAPTNPMFYDPSPANVAVGTTVTWTNDDATLHTATSGTPDSGPSGEFDSSYLAKGKTFQHTFDKAGTFDYYCTLHPFMIGQVVVK